MIDKSWRGRCWVVETDIADCFEAIPHDRLMAAIRRYALVYTLRDGKIVRAREYIDRKQALEAAGLSE